MSKWFNRFKWNLKPCYFRRWRIIWIKMSILRNRTRYLYDKYWIFIWSERTYYLLGPWEQLGNRSKGTFYQLCYDLVESFWGQEHWLWDIGRNKLISFAFYYVENPSIAHNFGTTGLIQVWFSAKCTPLNEHFNQIENWKCHMFDIRLISLDCIRFIEPMREVVRKNCLLLKF